MNVWVGVYSISTHVCVTYVQKHRCKMYFFPKYLHHNELTL